MSILIFLQETGNEAQIVDSLAKDNLLFKENKELYAGIERLITSIFSIIMVCHVHRKYWNVLVC
jgi:hypothetical protein